MSFFMKLIQCNHKVHPHNCSLTAPSPFFSLTMITRVETYRNIIKFQYNLWYINFIVAKGNVVSQREQSRVFDVFQHFNLIFQPSLVRFVI